MVERSPFAVLVVSLVALALGQNCQQSGVAPTPTDRPYFVGFDVEGNTHLPAIGETSQLRATAHLSDGSSNDVTTIVSWTVPTATIVSISAEGLVRALALGMTSVHAVYGVARHDVKIAVTPAGTFVVSGRIRQPAASGLSGVTVTEPVSGRSTSTDANGMFMLFGLVHPELRLTKIQYEPVTTLVAPFDDLLNVPMQPVMPLRPGGGISGTIAPNDLSYEVLPGTVCGLCRLVRIQSDSAGRLNVKLTWSVPATRMVLWAAGQEFMSASGSTELLATFQVGVGETIIYVGTPGTQRHIDFEMTAAFQPF
jgi:hypothetical protein